MIYDSRWPHISVEELACHKCGIIHGIPHPALCYLFEFVRKVLGDKPLMITSGSRCMEHQLELVGDGKHYAASLFPPHVPISYPEAVEKYNLEKGSLVFHALDTESALVSNNAIKAAVERLMPDAGIGTQHYGVKLCHFDVCHLAKQFLPEKYEHYWHPGRRW